MKKGLIFLGLALFMLSCTSNTTSNEAELTPEESAQIEKNEEVIQELSTATDELKKYNDDAAEALHELDSL
ncbi:hypothetical protein SAMN05216474_2700 [Lishizhenia tianjinensis]|uniref:Uncharacterized protein n=1 Tax=Lishizhenia tianjinensis TaxID=477690 RepID=A0A1I7BDF4_9FLAO|nr:hypothetical protein [Lishizhenia tianjinensis]SFT85184.1 hypothetical protein SAMN05216474_2700 [Lishizhenia tianjinensis]